MLLRQAIELLTILFLDCTSFAVELLNVIQPCHSTGNLIERELARVLMEDLQPLPTH